MEATGASLIRLVDDPETEVKPAGWTRFVCFSDTHGREDRIPDDFLFPADILLHGGDFTNTGEVSQVKAFAKWLEAYPAQHKVVIAGNHDITFQPDFYHKAWSRFHSKRLSTTDARAALIESGSCHYLEDECVELLGYSIYGSPWQPEFCDWAFNLPRGKACEEVWEKIPAEADIVITHGPPAGIGDRCASGIDAGCQDLLKAIRARRTPIHLSGHIHEGYGHVLDGETLFINASTCTLRYRPTNPPIVMDVPPAAELRTRQAPRANDAAAMAADAQ
mmetsp:Transcript_52681/g.125869  ORF Transcript_52681/g.125869 Transcript_52681/m.125869 type:complete len:277 (-) Transcript_52681:54-884(-)